MQIAGKKLFLSVIKTNGPRKIGEGEIRLSKGGDTAIKKGGYGYQKGGVWLSKRGVRTAVPLIKLEEVYFI